MKKIKNEAVLLQHGVKESRKIVLDILDETLCELDSYKRIRSMVSLKGSVLTIGNQKWDLNKKDNVYLISTGMAANAMARVFIEVLGERLSGGVIAVHEIEAGMDYGKVQVFEGGHPLANKGSLEAGEAALRLAISAGENDLFVGAMSGGCSSLMSCPMDGLTLGEEIFTRDILRRCGANVIEINSICRHISKINGGRLAKVIEQQGAEIISLLVMDALDFPIIENPGIPKKFMASQMAPDPTTLEDAKDVIKHYHIEEKLPRRVVSFFENCSEKDETPKDLKRWTSFLVSTLPNASQCAKEIAEKKGISAVVLTNVLEGESKEAGTFLASIAKEIQRGGQPFKPPCVLITTGEVSTQIEDFNSPTGTGGPSQELVIAFAIKAKGIPGACIASIDTEGSDGTSNAAGGIADSMTYDEAFRKKIDLYKVLREHAANEALSDLKGAVVTGETGVTLCDLNIMYVPDIKQSGE